MTFRPGSRQSGRGENHPHLTIRHADIGNPALVAELVAGADAVYHLAAAVGVALIARQPIQTIERNIYPTQLILSELQKHFRAGRAIPMFLASTSEVYGKNPRKSGTKMTTLFSGRPPNRVGAMALRKRSMSFSRWLAIAKSNCR